MWNADLDPFAAGGDRPGPGVLDAGDFGGWLGEIEAAIFDRSESDVPCGTCTGCCTSSQFIHIAPDETDALALIPPALLFPAPRFPAGHQLMGYDERGHCPMLIDDRCSIYEHRPRTCRTYDCRVFPAAGLAVGDPEKSAIAERAVQWTFSYRTAVDRARHNAVRAAAEFAGTNPDALPAGAAPSNSTQQAVLAIAIHDAFLTSDADGLHVTTPSPQVIEVELGRRRASGTSRRAGTDVD